MTRFLELYATGNLTFTNEGNRGGLAEIFSDETNNRCMEIPFRRRSDIMADLYDRQMELDLVIPEKVCIIGLGGIGSWVALNLSLVGVNKLFLIDYDIIEEHNLNRTPFRDLDIRDKKINAVMDLIIERRNDTEFRLLDKKVEELTEYELEELKDILIIDCRDNLGELPEELQGNQLIKLGYDGLSTTIMFNPDYNKIWEIEENDGYQVIPSFLAPCQFLATTLVTLITSPSFNISELKGKIITLDIREHMFKLLE